MSTYATFKQFVSLVAGASTANDDPEQVGYLLDLKDTNEGGVIGVYDHGECWTVFLRLNSLPMRDGNVYLASDRQPDRSRPFKTFEAAWSVIGQVCAAAGIRRSSIQVS